MSSFQKKLIFSTVVLGGLTLAYGPAVYAAKAIDLAHQKIAALQTYVNAPALSKNAVGYKEISRDVDFNKTLHVRVQQTYSGYPVWGADAIIHVPQGTKIANNLTDVMTAAAANNGFMNGVMYQDLQADLVNAPAAIFEEAQAQKALQQAIALYQHKAAHAGAIKDQHSDMIIFVDKNHKAHWAYKISFYVESTDSAFAPAKPIYIMDAITAQIYKQWNNTQTASANPDANGGGFGGNKKMGKLVYDSLQGDLTELTIQRDASAKKCYLQNEDVTVKRYGTNAVMSFACKAADSNHNNVFWDASFDAVNGGYSPGNDALSAGIVIKHMYQDWYGVPVLKNPDGSPMMLNMIVHEKKYDNAFWDGSQMTFGDGYVYFYPLTSLGVGAHEVSHGFTEQHSNLTYDGQSGGMNESFSDQAAQAAEYYSYGKNSWQIGPEIIKAENEALRYMDQPSKDCHGAQPGDECSIDDATEYTDDLDVHFSSGVYNHFFYALGTTQGWDAKKAFNVMVQANLRYWTADETFSSAACGVIHAASDLKYSVDDVKKAFDVVKVDYSAC
ncbi:MAG: M4 family metallopeptidase [Gammaproteobacteria bacterium]|nr:M4 family metallopeptidase [Gammaproteobacteria bacterium]